MTDTNNFDNIKASFDYISDALDSIRAQNAMSSGSTDMVLKNINNQLEVLAKEENAELIKVFLAEIKRDLEEKHDFVSVKFSEIKGSFNEIIEKLANQLQPHEIKELFEIIASNLSVFSQNFNTQKELINQIGLKVDEFWQDDSKKNDIIKNISTLKVEIDKFSNVFESIILKLNDSFSEVSQVLDKIDPTEGIKDLKKDIENIFLSSNAVLSTLQVIDKKNRELEEVITKLVTKEDFNLEQEQVAKLIAQNIQITEFIGTLPKSNQLDSLNEKVDTAIGIVNALKNIVDETGRQNQELLTVQLESLEAKILNISTEDEFIGFKKELNDFAKEVIQSTNLMRADLAETNSDLKDLLAFLNSMDIKSTFTNFANLTKTSESNVISSVAAFSENVSEEIDKIRKLAKVDIEETGESINKKIDLTKQELAENSKGNLASIVEHIQSVINNLFSVKNAMHIENAENIEAIDEKLQDLKEDLTASNNYVVKASQENVEYLGRNLDKVFEEVVSVKEGLSENSSKTSSIVREFLNEINISFSDIKEDLIQNSQQGLSNVLSVVEEFSQKISNLKEALSQDAEINTSQIKEEVGNLTSKMALLKETLKQDYQLGNSEIKTGFETFTEQLNNLDAGIKRELELNTSEIRITVEDLSDTFEQLKTDLIEKSQANISQMSETVENISQKFESFENSLLQSLENNSVDMENSIVNLSGKINELKTVLIQNSSNNLGLIQDAIENLSNTAVSTKISLEQASNIGFADIKSNVGELLHEISTIKDNFDIKSQSNVTKIVSLFDDLSSSLKDYKGFLSESVQMNFESISSYFQNLSQKIDEVKIDLVDDFKVSFSDIHDSILELPSLLKENQNALENENKILIEENSKTINEMSEKIQNLIKSLIANENPFKGEVLYEFSELKSNLQDIKDDLIQSNQGIGEKVDEKIEVIIQNLEEVIVEYNSKSNNALYNLQNKLSEYFEAMQQASQENELKLNNSIKETSEIKEEIRTLINEFSVLKNDSSIEDLATEINKKFEGVLLNITQLEQISASKAKNYEQTFEDIVNSLDDKFNDIKNNLKTCQNITTSEISDLIEDLENKVETVKSQIELTNTDIIDTLSSRTEDISEKLIPIADSVNKIIELDLEDLAADIKEQLEESHSSFLNLVKEELQGTSYEQIEKISTEFESLTSKLEENLDTLASYKETIADIKEDIKHEVQEIITEATQTSRDKVFEKLEIIEENILDSQDEFKTSILNVINNAQDKTQEIILIELQENIRVVKEVLDSASRETLDEKIMLKIDDLSSAFDKISDEIDEKLTVSETTAKESTQMFLTEVKTSFYEKVDDSLDELKSLIELTQDKNEYIKIIDDLKSDVFEKFTGLTNNIEETAASISFKDDFDSLNKDLGIHVNNLIDDLYDKILSAIETSKLNNDIFDKTAEVSDKIGDLKDDVSEDITAKIADLKDNVLDNIADKIEDLKSNVLEDITQKLESFETGFDEKSKDLSDLVKDVQTSLAELKENFVDLSLNSSMEMSSLLVSIQEKITLVETKLGEFDLNEKIENIETQINKLEHIEEKVAGIDLTSAIEKSKDEMTKEFEIINQKLDLLAVGSDSEIAEDVKEVKEILIAQKELITKLDRLEEAETPEDLVKLDDLAAIKTDIQKVLKAFEEKLDITPGSSGSEISTGDFREELAAVKEELLENLLEIFNQISFVSEAEDIKDFIEEKSQEIKEEIKSKIKSVSTENVSVGISDENLENILSEIQEVKNHLLNAGSFAENTPEYSYTLQDVESDIAKIRMDLKELPQVKGDGGSLGDLGKLNEDIMSISTRTNKLLLNSDESYAALKSNLDELRNIVYQFEEKVRRLDNKEQLDTINDLLISCVKSDKIFNQTFMYLAEWIDKADENINAIKQNMVKPPDMEKLLDRFDKRFSRQEEKIKSLEAKIEKLTKVKPAKEPDIRTLVQEVLSKVEMPELRSDVKLVKKVEGIDKQLASLGKSIEKITSYVD
ncbi:MAG: hypothetical protein PHC64_02400 [Candidatus Gastranaerophilales bacterium]|nr:hypothetical protein [Candidatus Gastranaerophilales bacterium]